MRVSGRAQDTRSQEEELQKWVGLHQAAVRWWSEVCSGRTMSRPEWDALWGEVKRRQIDTIVVWRLDRLGRTASGLTKLFDELVKRRVNLVSIKEGLDLNTASGRLMANVLASVAQFETEVRGERVAAGIAKAKAEGKKWGGWPKGKRRKLTKLKIQEIKRYALAGIKPTHIAKLCDLSRESVHVALRMVDLGTEKERKAAQEAAGIEL